MTTVCPPPPAATHPPTWRRSRCASTRTRTSAAHGEAEPIPVRPLIVDHAGTLSVDSSGVGLPSAFTVGVRVGEKLVLKHHAGESASTSVQVAGDQVYFELHAESDPGFRSWPMTVTLNGLPLAIPQHVTFDGPVTPFGGGSTAGATAPGTGHRRGLRRDHLLRAGGAGPERDRPPRPVPRRQAQAARPAQSALAAQPPLRADGAARQGDPDRQQPRPRARAGVVSADGTAFVTSHSFGAGRRGALSPTGDPASSAQAMFAAGNLSRASSGSTISAGVGISSGPPTSRSTSAPAPPRRRWTCAT